MNEVWLCIVVALAAFGGPGAIVLATYFRPPIR